MLHSSVLLNWRPVHTQEAGQKYCGHIISVLPALVKQNPRKTVKRKAPELCPGLSVSVFFYRSNTIPKLPPT